MQGIGQYQGLIGQPQFPGQQGGQPPQMIQNPPILGQVPQNIGVAVNVPNLK